MDKTNILYVQGRKNAIEMMDEGIEPETVIDWAKQIMGPNKKYRNINADLYPQAQIDAAMEVIEGRIA